MDKRFLSDLASFTVTAAVPIAVTPINDPPVIQLPFATIRMKSSIHLSDPDCLNVTAVTVFSYLLMPISLPY
jgi:hypothetical protein